MDRSNPSHPPENSFQNRPRAPRLVRRAAGVVSVLFLLTLLLGSSVPAGTAPTPVPPADAAAKEEGQKEQDAHDARRATHKAGGTRPVLE